MRAAFEFRHGSWFDDEIFDLLARVMSHSALPIQMHLRLRIKLLPITAIFGFVAKITPRRCETLVRFRARQKANWTDAFVYFKHEESGIGPKLARQMIELLGDA